MTPAPFPQANAQHGPPPDLDESQCHTIHSYVGHVQGGSMDGTPIVVTAWHPSSDELADLAAGKPLFLTFVGGLPPHYPSTDFDLATKPA